MQVKKHQDYGKLECYVDNVKRGEKEITTSNSTGDTLQAKGLNSLTTYRNIIVRVYDRAGNYKDTYPMTGTTMGRLVKPTVTIKTGTQGPVAGNYRGDYVVINIKDNAGENTGAEKIELTKNRNKRDAKCSRGKYRIHNKR